MTAERPAWMDGGAARPKASAKPFVPSESIPERRYSTHPNVVAGMTILTCVVLFNIFFWGIIRFLGGIFPPDSYVIGSALNPIEIGPTLEDYTSVGRSLVAFIFGVIAAAITWPATRGHFEQG